MRRESKTRGEGAFGLIVGLAVLFVVGSALWKIVPLHIHGNVVADCMNEQANFGNMKPPDKMKYEIYMKAQENEVPLPLKDIKVDRRENKITISAQYQQDVKILGYKYTYKFDRSFEKPVF
ncbi:MAG: hypothetical protein ABIT01_19135 [Thermoanaerobaculia bacterium]